MADEVQKFTSQYTGEQYDSAIGKVLDNQLGIPVGGTTGQILEKVSDSDLDTHWVDAPEIPEIPSDIVTKSDMDTAIQNAIDGLSFDDGLPAGGSAGQILAKKSNTDYDTQWIDAPSGGDGGSTSTAKTPVGTIVLWSMSGATSIPNGWHICDGTNGTPDLRDKFVLGAGNKYGVGKTGGEEEVTLTVEQIPAHAHSITTKQSSGSVVNTFALGGSIGNLSSSTTSDVGGSASHNNMPPYCTLYYIMKISEDGADIVADTSGGSGTVVAGVSSFNGRTGAVVPTAGDYTAEMVGARSSDWMPTATEISAVPNIRTINGKALTANITLSASDVGAATTADINTAIQQAILDSWEASY